jgi:hypothetical protein
MGELTSREEWVKPVNIENFATHYLGLKLDYTRLSDDGRMLGITTYADTEIELRRYCSVVVMKLPANMLILDERLKKPLQPPDKEIHRRRFTTAHECAQQLLHRMEPDDRRREMDARYESRVYSLRELKTLDDWREWQANAMAAALLIPAKYLALLLGRRRLTIYGKRMNIPDKLALDNLCNRLKVSRTAMTLRLRQLGYATVLPASAYSDPTDIECDNDFYSACM